MTLLIAALALASPTPDVLDVHPTQGPYMEIRHAVAAASSGDVIRVAPGNYGYFGVIGKGLTIIGSTPSWTVRVDGLVRVQDLPAGEEVVLAGFVGTAAAGSGDAGLVVADCRGSVRIEDCGFGAETASGIAIVRSDDVVLADTGGGSSESSGLVCWDSAVSVIGGGYSGASFVFNSSYEGWDGPPGIDVLGSDLWAQGCNIRGGDGGDEDAGGFGCSTPPGYGGDGIRARDSNVRILDCTITPGIGGDFFYCSPSPDGQRVNLIGASSSTDHPGPEVSLTVSCRLCLEASPLLVEAEGEVGATLLLVVGPSASRTNVPAYVGDLLTGGGLGAVRRVLMGPSPAQVQLTTPQLAAFGIESFHLQAVDLRSSGVTFGAVRSVTVLDSAW